MLWRFAWRNIWRNPRRTILTMLAIAFGAALLVFSIGLQLGQYDLMIGNATRVFHGLLQVQMQGYLNEPKMHNSIAHIQAIADEIRTKTQSRMVAARANGFALISSNTRTYGAMVVGVQPEYERLVSSIPGAIKSGHYFSSADAQEIILGRSLATNMKIGIGDEVTVLGSGRDGSVAATVLTVAGIFSSGSREIDRNITQIPLQTFQDVFSMEDHGHAIVIYDPDVRALPTIMASVQEAITDSPDLVVLPWEQLLPGLRQAIELDYSSGWFMYAVLVGVIVFSILNTFLMSVLERTREFGILLALGFKPLRIGQLVMLEATLLATIALLIGTTLGTVVNLYFYYHGLTFSGMEIIAEMYNMPASITPQISLRAIAVGPVFIFISTLLAALYPAMRIRRLKPVEAMRAI